MKQKLSLELKNNYCECGCGKKCKNRFIKGHNSRVFSDKTKQKIRMKLKGRKESKKTKIKKSIIKKKYWKEHPKAKERLSRLYKGNGNPMFGKKRPDLAKRNKKNSGERHPFYGKKRPKHSKKIGGENHFNWKGGISGSLYIREAHKIIKESTGIIIKKPMNTHHIDGNKKNNSKNNLLVCINRYHSWLHNELRRRYGKDWRVVFK